VACDACDRVDHGRIDVLVVCHVEAELDPLMLDDTLEFLPAQRVELMDEADTRVQLRVAGQAFLESRHADQHHAHLSTVVEVAQLLEAGRFQSVGFVNHEQVGRVAHRGCSWIAVPGGSRTQALDCPP
jgi:hypothetical protein